MLPFIKGLLTGMTLGIILYKVGASRYSRVIGMLTLRDTKIMKFAFTAIATAAFIYGIADILEVAENFHLIPRIMPYMNQSHIIGGIIFGVSLGATGFCPGTCAAKVGGLSGDKKYVNLFSVLGLLIGILAYAFSKSKLSDLGILSETQQPLTLHGVLGISYGALAIIWATLFAIITLVIHRFTPEKTFVLNKEKKSVLDYIRAEWSWLAGGILMGLLVTVSTMQDEYMGLSGSLLALVGWVSHLIRLPIEAVPKINDDIFWRSALIIGIFPGAYVAKIFSIQSLAQVNIPVKKVLVPTAILKAFTGGVGLSYGAMIGGGCTTGAFISAWPTMSVGSLLMGGTFFAASMATANLLIFFKKINFIQAQDLGDTVYD